MSDLSWAQFRWAEGVNGADNEFQNFPFRTLLIANLNRYDDGLDTDISQEVIKVDLDNFDRVIENHAPDLLLEVDNYLNTDALPLVCKITISTIDDFSPNNLLFGIDILNRAYLQYYKLCDLITKNQGNLDTDKQYEIDLLADFGCNLTEANISQLRCLQADLEQRIANQINAILHHPDFQQQEQTWRSVWYLVNQTKTGSNCSVELLNATKAQLKESFDASITIFESPLFSILHTMEYGQYGGNPFGAIVLGYDFCHHQHDVELLESLSLIGSHCHAPVIANCSPKLFGLQSFRDLENISSFSELLQSSRYSSWRSLCEKPSAQYLALTMPRFLLRDAYSTSIGDRFNIDFREVTSEDSEQQLLGLASYAFAACIIKSFEKYHLCVDIFGESGGCVPGYHQENPIKFPVEVSLSDTRERDIADAGVMPLSYEQAKQQLVFQSANSLRWGYVTLERKFGASISVSDRLSSQLCYLFVVCRIAHILKMVQRDSIGNYKSASDIELELNHWLKSYVTDVDNPPESVVNRRPLRNAEVTIRESGEKTHEYDMQLTIVPHVKYMDEAFTLQVNGHIGSGR